MAEFYLWLPTGFGLWLFGSHRLHLHAGIHIIVIKLLHSSRSTQNPAAHKWWSFKMREAIRFRRTHNERLCRMTVSVTFQFHMERRCNERERWLIFSNIPFCVSLKKGWHAFVTTSYSTTIIDRSSTQEKVTWVYNMSMSKLSDKTITFIWS